MSGEGIFPSTELIYKDLATSTEKRNRFEIPILAAILRTKLPKEQILVHKTSNLCATQNSIVWRDKDCDTS